METISMRAFSGRRGTLALSILCLLLWARGTAGELKQAEQGTAHSQLAAEHARTQAQRSVNELSRDIQSLKQSVVALNKDLRVLQEDLLFPANTQLTVFLSLDVGHFFNLESVKLKVDGREVAAHLYSDKERQALARGGMHRLHIGNVSAGAHTLDAFFTGLGPNGREYKRGTTLKVEKKVGPKYVELHVADSESKQQPEFRIREW